MGLADHHTGSLERLVRELDARGLIARVIRPRSGPAFCRVVNPAAAAMSEDVTCAPTARRRGPLYFWWSWGEPLHPVDDPGAAARKLVRVLAADRA